MTDAEFEAFVASSKRDLERKQLALTRQYGFGLHARWDYDQDTESLRFSDADGRVRVEAGAINIGSFSFKSQTWMWAWAKPSIPEESRTHSARLRELFDVTGMEAFRSESFEADTAMAWEVAAMSVAHLEAAGCYRGPAGELSVFLVIQTIRSLEPKE
ncbi:DUF6882 domain-containing protein [Fimbriiglobus ruber]|uniref:Uncharacterized protein n=1 Tax=Fimbriiglobus ruber TaxID=1908690 RepID=A0A225DQ36_9BACT|nr:DUF6882 domain-containing protein [Fimbriiglobus ruber]OWK41714.1 hypothetical protein FRUB_03792 [Fimbriiglobus ruber]